MEDIIGDGPISTILFSRPYLFEEWGIEILKRGREQQEHDDDDDDDHPFFFENRQNGEILQNPAERGFANALLIFFFFRSSENVPRTYQVRRSQIM